MDEIVGRFPKLEAAGGRLLLYRAVGSGPQRRPLEKVAPGPFGYTIPWLRERACVGSSTIYVMPVQTSILLERDDLEDTSTMPEVNCQSCGKGIPLIQLADHAEDCNMGEQSECSVDVLPMEPVQKRRTFQSGACVMEDVPSMKEMKKIRELPVVENVPSTSRVHSESGTFDKPDDVEFCPKCNKAFYVTLLPAHAELCGEKNIKGVERFTDNHYKSFVSLLEDADDDIHLFSKENETSELEDTIGYEEMENMAMTTENLSYHVQEYSQEQIKRDLTPVSLVIMRSKLMKSLRAGLGRMSKFHFNVPLRIEFIGEKAIDEGGPLREFCRLYIKEVVEQSGLLEGKQNAMLFTSSTLMLNAGQYEEFGKMFAYLVALGGPAMNCLHPVLYDYFVGLPLMPTLDVEDIPDMEEREAFKQVMLSSTDIEYHKALGPLQEWALSHGMGRTLTYGIEKKREFLEALWKDIVIYRRSAAITQFVGGLESTALMRYVKRAPLVWKLMFVHQNKKITRKDFKDLCKYEMSSLGSNLREAEQQTLLSWELLLQEIEDGKVNWSFHDLLAFVTGADSIPPMGFHKQISVGFYTMTSDAHYPTASTCDLYLHLPRGVEQQDLQRLMTESLSLSGGFGKL